MKLALQIFYLFCSQDLIEILENVHSEGLKIDHNKQRSQNQMRSYCQRRSQNTKETTIHQSKTNLSIDNSPIQQHHHSENYYPEVSHPQRPFTSGRWSASQQETYIEFLCEHREHLRDKSTRKSQKVFLHMSLIICSRNAEQCRTHHQKMLKFHLTLDNIIKFHRNQVSPSSVMMKMKKKEVFKGRQKTGELSEEEPYRLTMLVGNTIQLLIRTDSIMVY